MRQDINVVGGDEKLCCGLISERDNGYGKKHPGYYRLAA
jgi:hypothetical protein